MAAVIQSLPPRPAKSQLHGFYVIFVVSFVVFLLIALVGLVGPWKWRSWLPGTEGETSLIGAVKAAVYTFMSYLA
jgi:light-harvesting complex 1 beta chain